MIHETKYRLGVVGLGEGKSLLGAALDSNLWEISLICDQDERLCQERQREYQISSYTTDYEAMCSDSQLDAIAIYTPDPLHARHISMAMRSGKHVICTKPLMTDMEHARELISLQQSSGKRLMVGQSSRFFPTFQKQRSDFEVGKMGRVLSVETHYNGDKRAGTSGRWGKTGGNDWIFTGMSHPVDLAYWYLGPVTEVTGMGITSSAAGKRGGPEDSYHFVMRGHSGALARVTGVFGAPHAHPQAEPMIGCTVRGELGVLHASYPEFRYFTHIDGEVATAYDYSDQHADYFPFGGSTHHVGEFRNYLEYFGRCLREGIDPRPNLQDGVHVTSILVAMRDVLATGQTVRVPTDF
jgi:predicted dehydrogenase